MKIKMYDVPLVLKKLKGFWTKTWFKLPVPVVAPVSAYGDQAVPLKMAAEALPKLGTLSDPRTMSTLFLARKPELP